MATTFPGSMQAISKSEFDSLTGWLAQDGETLPVEIRTQFKQVLCVYSNLIAGATRAKQTLARLREAMGFTPKSERGSTDKPTENLQNTNLPFGSTESWSEEQQAAFALLQQKRSELARKKSEYNLALAKVKRRSPVTDSRQLEFDLARPNETLFSFPLSERESQDEEKRVNKMQEFETQNGLHVSCDFPKRVDLKVITTEITYSVETVTDPATGKSVRASMADEGPPGFQLTWGAVGNLVKMHVGFAIPINRIHLMIGQPEFTSSKICRVLQYIAMNLVGIYLHLSEQLSDLAFCSGDDTTTKVLEPESTGEPDSICDEIDAYLGWLQPRADGRGDKKQLNVSLLVGKSDKDPRSTIRFFRTHVGSVGNLLTKILESRNRKAGPMIFQGDLSNTNLPSPEIREKFHLAVAGCGAHARRPFWRYRKDDESLCYKMLKGFLLLAQVEKMIDARGRTRQNMLKLRGRYSRWIWIALRNRCIAATTGKVASPGTYPNGILPNIWPPNTELYKAAMYVINHFTELTLYLDHPELEYTNNGLERALRIEKCMLSSSKFRKTKRGRVTLDILRTINATCTAANVDITDYLRFVFKHLDETHETPESFTPFAFARSLDLKSANTGGRLDTVISI